MLPAGRMSHGDITLLTHRRLLGAYSVPGNIDMGACFSAAGPGDGRSCRISQVGFFQRSSSTSYTGTTVTAAEPTVVQLTIGHHWA